LQNPRISAKELSEKVFEQTLKQLPKVGKVRLAFDWTIENKQYLLVISLVRNGRAIPIFWRGYEEKRLRGKMKLIERAMLKRVLKSLQRKVGKRRIITGSGQRICVCGNIPSVEKREDRVCDSSQMQHFNSIERCVEESEKY